MRLQTGTALFQALPKSSGVDFCAEVWHGH